MPEEFFTVQSMLTLSGATGATFVICNGLQTAFNFNPKWLGLLVAMVIVLFGAATTLDATLATYLVSVINGFLVYCSAAGATGALGSSPAAIARGQAPASSAPSGSRRGFLTPWF